MSTVTALLLGIVQGLTEFLPVSSSGHLIVVRALMGWNPESPIWLPFDVACHLGTLAAVFAFFWSDWMAMLRALPTALTGTSLEARRIRLITIGTVPIVILGALGGAKLEDLVRTPAMVAVMFAIGGAFLLVAERFGTPVKPETALTPREVFIIGVAQATAIFPGMSRSGMTIGTGILRGFDRAQIARFTFLMSVPAILAAAAKEGLELRHVGLAMSDIHAMLIGILASALTGYLVIKYLLRFLSSHSLNVFGWYRLACAAGLAAWLAMR